MKKLSLIKGFLIVLLSVMLIGTTATFAADELNFDEDEGTSTSNSSNTNSNSNSNKTNTNSNSNSNKTNTNSNSNVNKNNTNNTSNTNKNNTNSSSYNNTNTNLPKTGIEDSIPTAVLVVIFGISAIYAYKKISEYKNI